MRRQIRGARAIVTGASSGIGRELALELGRRGASLILTARRADRLQSLVDEISSQGGAAVLVAGDITDVRTRSGILAAAREQLGGLDILINNAGLGAIGPFAEAGPDRLRRIMEVNFFAPVELLRAALPLLRDGRRSMVVNVSSVLSHRAVPNKSEYCASKFALHGFSDALRCELAASGVDILLVSPSTTASEFFDHLVEPQAGSVSLARASSPRFVARRTVAAIEQGRHEIILTLPGKALVWLDRLWPSLADRLLAKFG